MSRVGGGPKLAGAKTMISLSGVLVFGAVFRGGWRGAVANGLGPGGAVFF